jgi:hypothetical protein
VHSSSHGGVLVLVVTVLAIICVVAVFLIS